LCIAITWEKLQEPIGVERRIKLAHGDIQRKDREKNLNAILRKYDEELELLENL
jgi:hypothetical protein